MYRENAATLGALISEHPFARSWLLRLAIAGGSLFVTGAGLTAWMSDGFSPNNRASFTSSGEQWTVALSVGGILLVSAAVCFVALMIGRSTRAKVHEHGLVYETRGKRTVFRWQDVDALWKNEAIVGNVEQFRYAVADSAGRRVGISFRLAHVRDIAQRIERELIARRLPSLRAALDRGESVDFGEIRMSAGGLSRGRKQISWSELSAVRVDNRFVSVWTPSGSAPWLEVRTATLPNVELFAALAQKHVRIAR